MIANRFDITWSEEAVVQIDGETRSMFQENTYAIKLVVGSKCVVAVLPTGSKAYGVTHNTKYLEERLWPEMIQALEDCAHNGYLTFEAPAIPEITDRPF